MHPTGVRINFISEMIKKFDPADRDRIQSGLKAIPGVRRVEIQAPRGLIIISKNLNEPTAAQLYQALFLLGVTDAQHT